VLIFNTKVPICSLWVPLEKVQPQWQLLYLFFWECAIWEKTNASVMLERFCMLNIVGDAQEIGYCMMHIKYLDLSAIQVLWCEMCFARNCHGWCGVKITVNWQLWANLHRVLLVFTQSRWRFLVIKILQQELFMDHKS